MKENGTKHPRVRCVKISAEVTPTVGEIIKQMAVTDDRSVSYVAAKLLEESPRVKTRLREVKKH